MVGFLYQKCLKIIWLEALYKSIQFINPGTITLQELLFVIWLSDLNWEFVKIMDQCWRNMPIDLHINVIQKYMTCIFYMHTCRPHVGWLLQKVLKHKTFKLYTIFSNCESVWFPFNYKIISTYLGWLKEYLFMHIEKMRHIFPHVLLLLCIILYWKLPTGVGV